MPTLQLEEKNKKATSGSKKSRKFFCILVIISILLILAVLSVIIIIVFNKTGVLSDLTNYLFGQGEDDSQTVNVETEDDPFLGGQDAEVVIVEFADFGCPYCALEFPIVREIANTYGDKIKIIFRDLPDTGNHPDAQNAAEAAECAHEQEKFWEMHDKLFINQQNLDFDSLKNYAKELGLNEGQFNDCLDSHKYREEVLEDLAHGISAWVEATPTFFINGKKTEGAIPLDYFKELIDQELQSS